VRSTLTPVAKEPLTVFVMSRAVGKKKNAVTPIAIAPTPAGVTTADSTSKIGSRVVHGKENECSTVVVFRLHAIGDVSIRIVSYPYDLRKPVAPPRPTPTTGYKFERHRTRD
jgi:hypothetical protein